MLETILSTEVLSLLFSALSVIAALSIPAILMDRKNRRKYRRPTQVCQKQELPHM